MTLQSLDLDLCISQESDQFCIEKNDAINMRMGSNSIRTVDQLPVIGTLYDRLVWLKIDKEERETRRWTWVELSAACFGPASTFFKKKLNQTKK